MSSICAPDLGDEVQAADRLRRVAGQRHVDAVLGQAAVELRASSSAVRRSSSCLERHAHLVGRLADRPALLGRQLADRAQRRGQLGLAAEVADPQLLELGRARRRRRSRPRPRLAQLVQVSHGGHPMCDLVQRHGRGHRHVERVRPSHAGSARASAPRSAGSPPRSAPRQSTTRRRQLDVAQRRARRARRARPGGPASSSNAARAGGRAKIEPMRARTAFGEYGSAQPGPRTTGPSASACAERMIVPTLPGSSTPCR